MPGLIKDEIYSAKQLRQFGLRKSQISNIDMDVYRKGDKVYFFEMLDQNALRLFTIISNKSFYLK